MCVGDGEAEISHHALFSRTSPGLALDLHQGPYPAGRARNGHHISRAKSPTAADSNLLLYLHQPGGPGGPLRFKHCDSPTCFAKSPYFPQHVPPYGFNCISLSHSFLRALQDGLASPMYIVKSSQQASTLHLVLILALCQHSIITVPLSQTNWRHQFPVNAQGSCLVVWQEPVLVSKGRRRSLLASEG